MKKGRADMKMILVGSLCCALCPVLFGIWQQSIVAGLFMFSSVVTFGWIMSLVGRK